MKKEPERRLHLLRIAQLLRDELRSRGFNVLPGETAIVPVVIQQELDLCRLCKRLLEEGIYINPVLRPAAAQNLLRISCTAAHTEKHVDRLITTLVKVATNSASSVKQRRLAPLYYVAPGLFLRQATAYDTASRKCNRRSGRRRAGNCAPGLARRLPRRHHRPHGAGQQRRQRPRFLPPVGACRVARLDHHRYRVPLVRLDRGRGHHAFPGEAPGRRNPEIPPDGAGRAARRRALRVRPRWSTPSPTSIWARSAFWVCCSASPSAI